MTITFDPLGEAAVKLTFNEEVSPALNRKIQVFCRELASSSKPGITEWVPAYDSVTIYYEPWNFSYEEITAYLKEVASHNDNEQTKLKSIVTIPTLYGGDYGPDLEELAESKKMNPEDIITLHTKGDYLVNMIGFLPGFPYLSGLDERIAMPRLENPRQTVPAGSVGIAGNQTGIYPLESPGGWNLIGRTPLRLFEPEKEETFLFQPGDYLQFHSVSEEEFRRIQREIEEGTYKLKRKEETV
ncbi:5-oxoprolinase subunit PxpB [Pseudalkalibacillus hwajinpoensis]|uniref:5-oxoprolinase subunit PxpB n=1 Tax=Guptibacillus hwajinpoensis TaxID=208199 RepID=UPI00325C3275